MQNKRARDSDVAAVDAAVEVTQGLDCDEYLCIFSATQKEYAQENGLDLKSEAGRVLAAILSWPPKYTLSANSDSLFCRAYEVCKTLCEECGMCGDDFTDPKREAGQTFTEPTMVAILQTLLKPAELVRVSAGLSWFCNMGKTLQSTCGREKNVKPSSTRCYRTSTTLTERILDHFRSDFLVEGVFENIAVGWFACLIGISVVCMS